MSLDKIVVHGAREHNLKNIDVTIPRDKLVVLTAFPARESPPWPLTPSTPRASGAMWRAFLLRPDVPGPDGKARRGHDRRPFPGYLHRPEDHLQKPPLHRGHGDGNLRLPAAAVRPHRHPPLPHLRPEIKQQTIDQIVDQVLALPEKTRVQILAPVVRGRKGEHQKEFEAARKSGFVRARVDGLVYDLGETIQLEKNKKHTIEIIVDRLVIKPDIRSRLADSIETASGLTGGIVIINVIDGEDITFSQNYACPEHGVSVDELSPRMFSFNNPYGACKKCTGLGVFHED